MPLSSEDILADPIGAYPTATVACFDATTGELPRRRLDAARNREYLERLAAAGAEAVLIASSTGHGHLRTVEELEEWLRAAAEAETGEMVRMALLRPEDGEAANRRLIAVLEELEYPVVFIRPGTNLPPEATDRQIAENMQPLVAEAARRGRAVGVYSIPDVSSVRLSADAAAQLASLEDGDHIVAAKITEADYEASTRQFLRHEALRRWKIVQGWDPHLGRALSEGPDFDDRGRQRVGVTSGPMALAVYQYRHILAAAEQGNRREVEQAQEAVTAVFASMQDDPRRFADLQRAKYMMGLGHPLLAEVSGEQVEQVFTALERLPRAEDRRRMAASLDLMAGGPFHERLAELS